MLIYLIPVNYLFNMKQCVFYFIDVLPHISKKLIKINLKLNFKCKNVQNFKNVIFNFD